MTSTHAMIDSQRSTSLFSADSLQRTEQPYTLLRVKRRRDEDPLEALGKPCDGETTETHWHHPVVVESTTGRGKKYRGIDVRVFQFAQTVEDIEWADKTRKKAIQVCVAASQASCH
jgi:hypothetical protein